MLALTGPAKGKYLTALGRYRGFERRLRERLPFIGDVIFRRRILRAMRDEQARAERDPRRIQKLHEFFHTPHKKD